MLGAHMKNRLLSIDFLRGVAILLVLTVHVTTFNVDYPNFLSSFLNFLNKGGWNGVDLFFVLSGFLVSGLLFKEWKLYKKVDVFRFLVRRGLKIYPSFYLFILFTIGIKIVFGHEFTISNIIVEAMYLQNYLDGLWKYTWTLAVEEHFYLLLGFSLFFLTKLKAKNPFKAFVISLIPVCVAVLVYRCMFLEYRPFAPFTHFMPTHNRIDSLIFGVLLSYGFHFHRDIFDRVGEKMKIPFLILGLICVAPCWIFLKSNPYIYTFGFTVNYIGFGMILISCLHLDFEKYKPVAFIAKGIGKIGFYSYSIYVWHIPLKHGIYRTLAKMTDDHWWINFFGILIYPALSIIFGVIAAKIIEIPALKLRDKYFPSKSVKQEEGQKIEAQRKTVA